MSWARRGLNLLLDEFPDATVETVERNPPWMRVDLRLDGDLMPFAIWQETGCVYSLGMLAVADPLPVLVPSGSPFLGSVSMPSVNPVEHVQEDLVRDTFTFFLPDSILTVPSTAVVTTFVRAREAVNVWLSDSNTSWSEGAGWNAMHAVECEAFPDSNRVGARSPYEAES